MERRQPFFQAGGNLDADAPSYVERPADNELMRALENGELCLVLAPRQTGKSSLMVRTRARLLEKGTRAGMVDLQPLGGQKDPEKWFNDVIYQIEDSLGLETDSLQWWEENRRLGPMQRFMKFLEHVVLGELQGDVVLFIDEIDSALGLPFADDFFTTLRSFFNLRSTKPDLKRLTFALLGVANASEFIKDRSRTPFNIGTSIQLTDFTPDKIKGFQKVLGPDSDELIQRIFRWTSGQPFLVQTLAAQAYSHPGAGAQGLDAAVEEKFFQGRVEQDTHLKFIQDYLLADFLADSSMLRQVLKTYRKILRGENRRARQAIQGAKPAVAGRCRHSPGRKTQDPQPDLLPDFRPELGRGAYAEGPSPNCIRRCSFCHSDFVVMGLSGSAAVFSEISANRKNRTVHPGPVRGTANSPDRNERVQNCSKATGHP